MSAEDRIAEIVRALLDRFGLRPTRPSSARNRTRVGQIYFGD